MSTYGASGAPSQNTINYDSILGTSLFNYRRTLTDNISKSNPFFYKIKENGMYVDEDGGVAIQIPLMYGLGQADTYSGYDVLNTDPTDGITNAFFDWRQMAVPISISRLEERQNAQAHRMIKLMETKMKQAETGLQEFFAKQLIQGAALTGTGNIYDNYTSPRNGSSGIEPLSKLVALDPTSSTVQPTIGNINQSTSTWWRNQTKTAAITSASKAIDFLMEADSIYNDCAKGPGGPPDLILVDQTTYQVWRAAYYQAYRRTADEDKNYPFENFRFNRALVMWDEFMVDSYSNTTSTATYGTAFFFNTKFLQVTYDSESNFINTPFVKPANQDAKVAHILWMGNTCLNNRRKHGVWAKIPRTLAWA